MSRINAWCQAEMDTLRTLWAAGVVVADIARQIGVTRNSIIGKARRLGLAGRPSPIIRAGIVLAPRPARAGLITLTNSAAVGSSPLPAVSLPRPSAAERGGPVTLASQESGTSPQTHVVATTAEAGGSPAPRPATRYCQWPVSSGRPWRMCEAPSARGSYCAEHGALAYHRVRMVAA